jgi:hypothetical protein
MLASLKRTVIECILFNNCLFIFYIDLDMNRFSLLGQLRTANNPLLVGYFQRSYAKFTGGKLGGGVSSKLRD